MNFRLRLLQVILGVVSFGQTFEKIHLMAWELKKPKRLAYSVQRQVESQLERFGGMLVIGLPKSFP